LFFEKKEAEGLMLVLPVPVAAVAAAAVVAAAVEPPEDFSMIGS